MKKRIFSGIQPTGGFTLGNYLGALKNWAKLQEEYECIYCIVNLHAITVDQDPKELREHTRASAALTIACGVDISRSTLFVQSDVSTHAEVAWALGCFTPFGELSRMTQFKEKSAKHSDNINSGLFTYPVLMASDILSYDSHLVPVGADQRQHLELARNIAQRVNHRYGDTLVVPEGYIPTVGARIMSLCDPTAKMSKSDPNENSRVLLSDSPDVIMRRFKRAVTDSSGLITLREDGPGIANLMSIYSVITGKNFDAIENEFDGKGYGDFKKAVGEAVCEELLPIQQEYKRLLSDPGTLDDILKKGADKAREISTPVKERLYKTIGIN